MIPSTEANEHIYRSFNYPDLILSNKIPKIIYSTNDSKGKVVRSGIKVAEEAYTLSFKEIKHHILNKLPADNADGFNFMTYIGILQNPNLTSGQIQKLWNLGGSDVIARVLWETEIPWKTEVLDLLTRKLAKYIDSYGASTKRTTLRAVGRYPYWTTKNCHFLARVYNNDYIVEAVKWNPNISVNTRVMLNLIVS